MVDQLAHAHPHPSDAEGASDHAMFHRQTRDAASAAAITVLREAGERVTGSRRAVLAILAGHTDYLSADQVSMLLESRGANVHRATVYRTLERLAEIGVATSMQVAGGATLYHLTAVGSEHEHLHARCRDCGDIVVVPLAPLVDAAARIAASGGFRLDPAQSTLVGLCVDCAGKQRR